MIEIGQKILGYVDFTGDVKNGYVSSVDHENETFYVNWSNDTANQLFDFGEIKTNPFDNQKYVRLYS
jgi:hypothetical protein